MHAYMLCVVFDERQLLVERAAENKSKRQRLQSSHSGESKLPPVFLPDEPLALDATKAAAGAAMEDIFAIPSAFTSTTATTSTTNGPAGGMTTSSSVVFLSHLNTIPQAVPLEIDNDDECKVYYSHHQNEQQQQQIPPLFYPQIFTTQYPQQQQHYAAAPPSSQQYSMLPGAPDHHHQSSFLSFNPF